MKKAEKAEKDEKGRKTGKGPNFKKSHKFVCSEFN